MSKGCHSNQYSQGSKEVCRDGRLEELSMPGNGMSCALPAKTLQSLPRLTRLDLSGNRIKGRQTSMSFAELVAEEKAPQLLCSCW